MKPTQKAHGFTLIELMIVIVIVAVLSAIAIPSYRDFVVRSKRSDAKVALTELANLQEKYYSENGMYTTDLSQLPYPATTSDDVYMLAVPSADADGYRLRASTDPTTGQHKDDTPCRQMELTNLGVRSPNACWEN